MRLALAILALATFAGPVLAGDDIEVSGAWARPSLGQTGASALYFTLTNGAAADVLTSVDVPDVERAEVHETTNTDGVMAMRPVAELPLAPGVTVSFAPGGKHVMLMGLKKPLKVGDHIAATLRFKAHAPLAVDAVISMTAPVK